MPEPPPGFITINRPGNPPPDQLLLEVLIASRFALRRKNHDCTQQFADVNLCKRQQEQLPRGTYYHLMINLISTCYRKNARLESLILCLHWLRQNAVHHAPLRFELGLCELACYLRQQHRIYRPEDSVDTASVTAFYYQTVHPELFIGQQLTSLSRRRYGSQDAQLEQRMYRRYTIYTYHLLQAYGLDPECVCSSQHIQSDMEVSLWHTLLHDIYVKKLPLPPGHWLKASVNRQWQDLAFFMTDDQELGVEDLADVFSCLNLSDQIACAGPKILSPVSS